MERGCPYLYTGSKFRVIWPSVLIIQRGVATKPPLGKYVREKPSGEQGLKYEFTLLAYFGIVGVSPYWVPFKCILLCDLKNPLRVTPYLPPLIICKKKKKWVSLLAKITPDYSTCTYFSQIYCSICTVQPQTLKHKDIVQLKKSKDPPLRFEEMCVSLTSELITLPSRILPAAISEPSDLSNKLTMPKPIKTLLRSRLGQHRSHHYFRPIAKPVVSPFWFVSLFCLLSGDVWMKHEYSTPSKNIIDPCFKLDLRQGVDESPLFQTTLSFFYFTLAFSR